MKHNVLPTCMCRDGTFATEAHLLKVVDMTGTELHLPHSQEEGVGPARGALSALVVHNSRPECAMTNLLVNRSSLNSGTLLRRWQATKKKKTSQQTTRRQQRETLQEKQDERLL